MGKKEDAKNRMFLKPSPNEEVKLLQSEKEKLRKLRLQQVREQEKVFANRLRNKFKKKERNELVLLGNELKRAWEEDITEKKSALENIYFENVSHVGEGHQDALMRHETGERKEVSLEEQAKVAERYKQAMKKLKAEEVQRAHLQNAKTEFTQRALEIEKQRAAKIASLHPPAPDIAESLEMIQKHKHKEKRIDQYSSTYYHLPQQLVEKAGPNDDQFDAREAARDEGERIQNAKQAAERNFSEQMEKARLRHKHARAKLLLEKDHDKLLKELDHFERMDRQRRQDIVSKIPKHIFEPPHRRLEANEERQREIEHAFEDMYMAQTNYMGDVSDVRGPLSSSPAVSDQTQDTPEKVGILIQKDVGSEDDFQGKHISDLTRENNISDGKSPEPVELLSGVGKKKIVEEAEKSRGTLQPSAKADPLKRLMKKIDLQRDRWRSMNKLKTDKKEIERLDSDQMSEFSEGMLTMTSENTPDTTEVPGKPKRDLLHPYEEAVRTRVGAGEVKEHRHDFVISTSSDVEKQKQLLQQQKLKLQLQQQQVLQEHLQLQFDMLHREKEADDDVVSTPLDTEYLKKASDHDDIVDNHDEMLSSVSTGLLSEEEKTVRDSFHDEEPTGEKIDISLPITSHHVESRLSSIPESVFEEDFVRLTPVQSDKPTMGIISQRKPIHIQLPTSAMSPEDRTEEKNPSFDIPFTQEPPAVGQPPTIFTVKPKLVDDVGYDSVYPSRGHSHFIENRPFLPSCSQDDGIIFVPEEHPPVSVPSAVGPSFSPATSDIGTPDGDLPIRFHLAGNKGTDAVSYLKFYQEQLVEQQERIREQQRAIQERQQQRLEQLKQFQEQIKSLRTGSADLPQGEPGGLQNMTDSDSYWRSLIPTSGSADTKSSSAGDSRFSTERLPNGHFSALNQFESTSRIFHEKEMSNGGDETSSSLSPYPSVIVPPRSLDDVALFPKPAALGLFSDSTIQLSSSELTKSSSNATMKENSVKEQLEQRYQSEVSSSSLLTTRSSLDASRVSGSTNTKSKSSFESGPLSSSNKTNKSRSSISSDNNNNEMLQLERSFQHFHEMIEEAKTLNKKYLSPSKLDREDNTEEEVLFNFDSDKEFDERKTVSDYENSDPKEALTFIPEEVRGDGLEGNEMDVHGSDDLSYDRAPLTEQSLNNIDKSLDQLTISDETFDDTFKPLQNLDDQEYSSKESSIADNYISEKDNTEIDYSQISYKTLSIIPEETFASEVDFHETENIQNTSHSSEYKPDNCVHDNVENKYLTPDKRETDAFSSYKREYPVGSTETFIDEKTADYFKDDSQKNHSLIFPSYHSAQGCSTDNEHHETLGLHSFVDHDAQQDASPSLSTDVRGSSRKYDERELEAGSERVGYSNYTQYRVPLTDDESVPSVFGSPLSQKNDSNTEVSDLNLQDAFRKHRFQFIKRSEERVRAAKEARLQDPKPPVFQRHNKRPSKTSITNLDRNFPNSSVKETRSEEINAVKISHTKQKIDKRDMIERSKRLYQKLPDVQKKQLEKQREDAYAANRAKAQEFQKQTRERLLNLKKKKPPKKK